MYSSPFPLSCPLTVFWDLDAEGELVSDAHSLDLASTGVQDSDPWWWGLRRRVDVDGLGIAHWHHSEGDVLRAHVVRALDLVDLVGLGHHHGVVLQDNGVGVDSGGTLGVAVLSRHGQVQSESVRVDDIDVTGLRAAQSVDTSVEGLVGAHLDGNSGVLAVDSDWRGRSNKEWVK